MRIVAFVLPAVVGMLTAISASAVPFPNLKEANGAKGSLTFAQTNKPTKKNATRSDAKKSAHKKTMKTRRRVPRTFASLTCSVEANKKGLKGAKRKAYRKKCLRAASACSVSARKKGLKGRALIAFRKQCITIAARKTAA